MTGVTAKHLIETQIPFHIREANPLLVKFLEYYYEFLTEQKITDIIQNVISYNDADSVDESYLTKFFEEFRRLPLSMVANKRLVAKHIFDLYKTKGTEKSLILLFQIVFGENIEVYYPSESILRASDGIWFQESYITLTTRFGILPVGIIQQRFYFTNQYGSSSFISTRISQVNVNTFKVHFRSFQDVRADLAQEFYVYDDANIKTYVGALILSPSKLSVLSYGKFWQVGSAFYIPGSPTNTIARVTTIDENGGMRTAEIIEFGTGHSESQTTLVSPFPARPVTSSYVLNTLPGASPGTYIYNLTVTDVIDYLDETVTGNISGGETGYFLENYAASNYNSSGAFETEFNSSTISNNIDYQITVSLEDWLLSRATVRLDYETVAKERGYFLDNRGKLSNEDIRLEDNYFYQLYSYVIRTTNTEADIIDPLSIIHPAGTQYFIENQKQLTYDVGADIDAYRTITDDARYLFDTAYATEALRYTLAMTINDTPVAIDDSIVVKDLTMLLSETPVTTSDTGIAKDLLLGLADTATSTEAFSPTSQTLGDSTPATEGIVSFDTSRTVPDTVAVTETIQAKDLTKYITGDSVIAFQNDVVTVATVGYAETGYDQGDYSIIVGTTLTIT